MSHRNDCNGFLLSATTLPPTPNFSHGRQSSTWERLNQIMTFFSSKLSNSFPSQDKIQSPDHHLQDLKNTAPSISLTPSLTRSLPRSLVFSYSGFEVFVLTFSFAWNAFHQSFTWFISVCLSDFSLFSFSKKKKLFLSLIATEYSYSQLSRTIQFSFIKLMTVVILIYCYWI